MSLFYAVYPEHHTGSKAESGSSHQRKSEGTCNSFHCLFSRGHGIVQACFCVVLTNSLALLPPRSILYLGLFTWGNLREPVIYSVVFPAGVAERCERVLRSSSAQQGRVENAADAERPQTQQEAPKDTRPGGESDSVGVARRSVCARQQTLFGLNNPPATKLRIVSASFSDDSG